MSLGVTSDVRGPLGAAISGELRAKLATSIREPGTAQKALETVETQKSWAAMRARDPGHGLFGDEANRLTDEQIKLMHKVVIAGPGGTGISAAEIILAKNTAAGVVMLGNQPTAGITEDGQFRSVVAKHGTRELSERFHIDPAGIDGRLASISTRLGP